MGIYCIVEDITFLQFSIVCGSRACTMRTINSIGSADQGMMSSDSKSKARGWLWCISSHLILSYRCGDRGPGDSASMAARRSLAHRHTHTHYYDIKWNGQDTHKGLASYSVITTSLVLLFSFSSIKKILYNAIIPARTVLFWCATVFLLLTLGSSSWSHRDAGTTRTMRHRHRISMTH